MLKPKLFETLKNYDRQQFGKDLMAGLIVGIVALPLAIAFAIASGVSPEKGIYTAIIGGFIISALGGSKVQIGGPTGAFIVIVYGIVQQYGIDGLIVATFMAGIMLIIMGFAKLGAVIKFIPHPLIIGFTSGIALIIFSSEIKDFFGLKMGTVPANFLEKWKSYILNFHSLNIETAIISCVAVGIILLWPKVTHKIPGSLIAIFVTTIAVQVMHLPVESIGSRFGAIPSILPRPVMPHLDFANIKNLIRPAFTIALLGGIESLLSAVVADGMIGGNHRSNMELIAQGTANIFSSVFGGIPATGAIARTATNIKNGGRTPVAGMIHSVTLLLILVFFGKWASLIPMGTLAAILVVIAYNMSEWQNFISVTRGPRNDTAVLLITFFLTVIFDLTIAIEVGMVLAAFLFMRKMIQFSNVSILSSHADDDTDEFDKDATINYTIPVDVEVFEITGPFFFGAAYKFKDAIKVIEKKPKILIIRMRHVPLIDATGIHILREVFKDMRLQNIKIILAGVTSDQVMAELKKARIIFTIGKGNITPTFEKALLRCKAIIDEKKIIAG
ncbi:MAG: sulfate permease [Ginsengibacter sp.]